eukprot:5305597-Amphidinium_carterae.1
MAVAYRVLWQIVRHEVAARGDCIWRREKWQAAGPKSAFQFRQRYRLFQSKWCVKRHSGWFHTCLNAT